MATLIIMHQVADYDAWRRVYDAESKLADAYGRESARVMRNTDDPNEVVVIETFPSADQIQELVQSEELATAMQGAGVTGKPTVYVIA